MSASGQTAAEALRIDALRIDTLYREKVRAEIAEAEALVPGDPAVRSQGDELADVLLAKGEPGAGERAHGRALAGEDGVAIGKALDALGLPEARFAVCTRVGAAGRDARVRRLRLLVETVDPAVIIALDTVAAEDVAAALGAARLSAGKPVRVQGRTVLALDDFEGSLGDEGRKRQAWKALKSLGA